MSDKIVKIGAGYVKVDTLDIIKRVMDAQKIKDDETPSEPVCVVLGAVPDDKMALLEESLKPVKLIVVDDTTKIPTYDDVMDKHIRPEVFILTAPEEYPMPDFKKSGWKRNKKSYFGRND